MGRPPFLNRKSVTVCLHTAAAIAVLGALAMAYLAAQTDAARRMALLNGPPQAVSVEDFQPGRDTGPAGEVALKGRVDPSLAMLVEYRDGLRRRAMTAIPLLPAAEGAGGAVGYVALTPEQASAAKYGEAQGGRPVIGINGDRNVPGALKDRIEEAFAGIGYDVAGTPVYVRPFEGGREAALSQPAPMTSANLLFVAAGVTFALGLLAQRLPALPARPEPMHGRAPHPSGPRRRPAAASRFEPLAAQSELNGMSGNDRPGQPTDGQGNPEDRLTAALRRRPARRIRNRR